jgi:hypothetical protein
MKKKKSRGPWKTNLKLQTKIDSMDHFKYGSSPSTLMSTKTDREGMADRELKRMVKGDVFRSNKQTVAQSNSNKRRYK